MADGNRRRKLVVPSDIVTEILLRLPVKPLKRFKSVCKPWYDLISDSSFVTEHANRAKNCTNRFKVLVSMDETASLSIDYEDLLKHEEGDHGHVASTQLKLDLSLYPYPQTCRIDFTYIMGSCDGLICLHGVGRLSYVPRDFVLLWNPSTGDTCKLPQAPRFRYCHPRTREYHRLSSPQRKSISLPKLFGFGYDSRTEDYKVLLGNMSSTATECTTQIYIFALKTGSWRCYEESRTIEKKEYVKMGGQGCFANGALHWIELVFDSRRCLDGSRSRIVAFDLAEEKFREMTPLSSFMEKEYLHKIDISSDIFIGIGSTVENRIIVYFYNKSTLALWVMKEYGIEESWVMFLRIPWKIELPRNKYGDTVGMNDYLFPVHILEDGKVLMSCDDKKLVLYDPKDSTKRTVLEASLSSYAVVYVVTLISPRIGGGAGEEEEEAAEKNAMLNCLNLNKKVLSIYRNPWILV